MKIPEPENNIAALIDKYHESKREQPRPHMGASTLGHPCDRWLWLSFRWAVQPEFKGRILRLFRRGHNEEMTIVNDLRAIGIDIRNVSGKQTRVDFGKHVSGSIDGIIHSGVPEAPNTRHVAEFKTHSAKSYNDLEKHGVEKSKPQHFIQMQVYMHGTGTERALYLAVCKDDDRLYTERVRYDKDTAEKAIERGQRLVREDRLPPPISTDPSWYQCKFCDAHEFCHTSKKTKHVNCRTCAHSTAMPDSTWRCERHQADGIPVEFQHQGCEHHVIHPDLVPWEIKESDSQWQAIYIINGKDVLNGGGGGQAFESREILANPDMVTSGDETLMQLRETFDARIVE